MGDLYLTASIHSRRPREAGMLGQFYSPVILQTLVTSRCQDIHIANHRVHQGLVVTKSIRTEQKGQLLSGGILPDSPTAPHSPARRLKHSLPRKSALRLLEALQELRGAVVRRMNFGSTQTVYPLSCVTTGVVLIPRKSQWHHL